MLYVGRAIHTVPDGARALDRTVERMECWASRLNMLGAGERERDAGLDEGIVRVSARTP